MRQSPLTVIALLVLASCDGPSSSPSVAPDPLTPTLSPPTQPPPNLYGPGVTLSGQVFEVLQDGMRRPISARAVSVEVDVPDVLDPQRGGWVPVDANGRYRLSGVPDNRFVKISGVDTFGFSSSPFRFCGTNTITRGDSELDVALYRPGVAVPGPTLSGQVSAVINRKLAPLARVAVYFKSRAHGPDVMEFTDSDGRYSLCGIPPIPGSIYMYCGNDVIPYDRAVDVHVDTNVDIDATDFYQCL